MNLADGLGAPLLAFRDEVRAWIEDNRVDELTEVNRPEHRAALYNLSYGHWTGRDPALAEAWEEWQARNAAAGYMCPHWPGDVGGRGWDAVRMAVWSEELARAGMPRANRGLGEHLVGPALIVHGSPEQRLHFLPRIISGADVYGQGFSEPDAGSDLASLRTRGRVEGDELIIDGEKVWTSLGHLATKLFLLCRTDPDAPLHRGLSCVIVEVAQPGVELRRVRQMTGACDFTEERLSGARAPLDHVIGGLGNGWKVAMTVLGHERGQMATVQHLALQQKLRQVVDDARSCGRQDDPVLRRRIAVAYARVEALRAMGMRTLAGAAYQRDIERMASSAKVYISELDQSLARLAFDLRGVGALGAQASTAYWAHELLHSRCLSIQGGTNEIQRNILGERVLGLEREPRAAPR